MRSLSKVRLGTVTALTMAVSTFPFVVFSVLAADLIDEFSISRAQLGILAMGTGLIGALSAPFWGRVTDRIGPYRATSTVLVLGAVTLLGLSVSPTYIVLFLAALITGIPNGWSNPATNSLIVDTVPSGLRGVVTGVKQSGVQVGTFLGGALLPLLAVSLGWRWAAALFVVIPVAGLLGLSGRRPAGHQPISVKPPKQPLPRSVVWLAVYGTVSGLATSAMFVFLPLFAEEDQLWTAQAAGSLIAVIGLVGIGARILWSRASETRIGHGRTLRILAFSSTIAAILLALAATDVLPSWVLVLAAILFASGSIAWNAVGMLAVMDFAPPAIVGRSTGVVLLGFLLGYATGAPIMGFSVDTLGSYAPGWVGSAVLLAATAVIAGRIPPGSTLRRS